MCPNCKVIADKTIEKKVDLMKKQSLKRDKTIQGLTEILYRKEKDLKYFRNKLGEKEALDQLLKLVKQSVNSAITTTEIDQTVITNLSIALRKYLSTYQDKEEIESLENSIESFEKHYLQWLTMMQNKSVNKEESSLEETNDDMKKELASLHQAVKDKNLFIQELLTERKNAVTENSKSVENLLNNLKQKDIYIQDLQSKLEELEKCLKKEENIKEKDLIQSKVDITELMNKKEELASDNEKLKLEHSKIKEKLDAVLRQKDNEIERLNELCEKLQHKTEELEFEIDEKMGELHECEKERDSLKEQFSLQKEKAIDIVNYEKEIELVKEQFENIKLELENTKLANNTLQNAITEKDNLLEIVNKRHIELQNEYIKSQHSLTEKDKLFCELKTKLEEMTSDFSKIKKIKQFESDELGRLRNEGKIAIDAKEKQIQELKCLLQEKTLMIDALNVELELKENVAEQLHDSEHHKSVNRKDFKIMSKRNSLNKFVSQLKRHSLPVYVETEKCFSRLLGQNLTSFGQSDDIYVLKEEICFLILKIENLEQQIQESNGGVGSNLNLLSGVSEVFPNSSLNKTAKTLHILHAHIEELANFLECLLRFDSDGQLDISLLTPKNVARLKKYLADSKELSQSFSASLLGEEFSFIDNSLDLEPSKDIGKLKDWTEIEKIADEKTENLKNQMAECHAALQNKVLECNNLIQTKEMLERELLVCQEELASCREMLEELKIKLEDKDKNYQKLLIAKDQLELKDNENCTLHREVHRKLVSLSNLVENMQKRLAEEERKVVTISKEKSELERQLNKVVVEMEQIQHLNLQLQNELKEREIICNEFESKLQNEIEEKKLISENLKQKLENEIQEKQLISKNFEEKLENEIKEKTIICQSYEEKLQNELKEKKLIFQDYQEIKNLLGSLQQNCIQLKSELEGRISSEKELIKEKTLLERDVYCRNEQIKDLEQSLKNCEKELEEKQLSWQTNEKENIKHIEELQEEKNRLNKRLQSTEKELFDIQNLCTDLKTQIHEFNMKSKLNKKEEFVKEMQYLRKELKRNLHSNKKLCDKMEKLQCYEQTYKESSESDIPTRLMDTDGLRRSSRMSMEILKDRTNLSQNYKMKWRSWDNLSRATDFSHVNLPKEKGFKLIHNVEDSVDQSHYTSPDLGIDSDPSQDSKIHKPLDENQNKVIEKESAAIESLKSLSLSKDKLVGQALYAVSQLQDYELLKKEIEESLVLIKGVQARIKDRLITFSSKNSPGKSLEYSTLKEINSSCASLEAYLEESYHLVSSFWITSIPQTITDDKTDSTTQNDLLEELEISKSQLRKLTKELKEANDKIYANERRKEKMEKAINHQLLKTRRVLTEAKGNLEKHKLPENSSSKSRVCK
ncbi:putative leucine-rich repeat-containing protein DDB_G0290503 isoform X2 [Centruroides sculpturatus]|uniref:putative leucine-rich repeat-containing protein DDB_G0290503 isoform X2 n=1 Tax=Centruroides sculpturatus TaxID=218467 RepID=UPI000C6E8E9A|nr:putative leucine-rich repeat-containing protein DDB_G0290503 isoform X2 [Centruroides sculpturatus]